MRRSGFHRLSTVAQKAGERASPPVWLMSVKDWA
jgi:hypothetical protein